MIALALVYAGLAVLFLAGFAGDRLGVIPRAAMIVVCPALAFAVWQTSRAPTGWPSTAKPEGTLVSGFVREPEPGDPGEIDMWMVPAGALHPRAFAVPYTRQLHRQLMEALTAAQHGERVGVKRVKSGIDGSKAKYRFYREPPPGLPTKPR